MADRHQILRSVPAKEAPQEPTDPSYDGTQAVKDVVTAVRYDNQGRPYKVYEPRKSDYADGQYFTVPDTDPHTLTTYEASPLNRVATVKPPSWPYVTTYSYGTNSTAVTSPGGQTYGIGELMVHTVTDPEGVQKTSYKDKKGRQVLSQVKKGSSQTLTYYDFDDKDRVKTIYPPSATATTSGLLYQYTYDGADIVLTKKIPDQGPISYQYNDRELVTFMQDANMAAADEWLHTVYIS